MTPADLLKQFGLTPGKEDVQVSYERQLWQAKFSPCGQFLIGCGYDASIQRWRMGEAEPQTMAPLSGHNGWVQEIDFAATSKRLLSVDSWGKLTCQSYDADQPQIHWSHDQAHDGWIRAVAVSPNGQQVATGGNGSVVRLWSVENGQQQTELAHPHRVYSLRFHPDGKTLVSGDLTGVIRQWNLANGKVVRELDAQALYADEAETKGRIQQCGGARVLHFNADGSQLVCGGQKEPGGGFATGTPCAIVYDWKSGEKIREMPMGGTQDGFTYDARFHPSGFVMATSSAFPGKGHVWFWRPEDDKAFFTSKKMPNGRSLSLHPDGKRIAHLTSNAPNANGRPLKDGEYQGGSAEIRILNFPA